MDEGEGAAACAGRPRIKDVQHVNHVRKKGRRRWNENMKIIMSFYKILSNLKGLNSPCKLLYAYYNFYQST